MNLIVKAIDHIGKFRADIIACKIENSTRINDVKLQQYENAIKKMETKDRVDRLELEIKYQNKLKQKAFLYNLISIIGTIGSIALTLCGITGASFTELFSTSKNITYSVLIIFSQFAVWAISANKHYIKNKFYNNYSKLKILQICVIFTSMTCNYLFLASFLKPDSTLRYIFLILMAISIDLISLTFCALAQDCKYRNYSYKYDKNLKEDVGLFEMLGFIMTYKLRTKVKNKYIAQLNEYQNTFEYTTGLEQKTSDPYYTIPQKDTSVIKTLNLTDKKEASSALLINKNNAEQKQLSDNTHEQVEKPRTTINKNVTADLSDNTKNELTVSNHPTPTNTKKETTLIAETTTLEQPANILNFPKHKNTPLKNYGIYESVKKKLANLDDNTILSASKLAINPTEWKKIKERLVREDLAYEQNSRIRKKSLTAIDKAHNS